MGMSARISLPQLQKAVFLDRDGTLNRDTGYLHKWSEWCWLPGVIEGLKILQSAGYRLIVVSNQSGIARGFYTLADWHRLNEQINENLAKRDVKLDAFYCCPHHPDFTGPCLCRKPQPGLLFDAAREMNIELSASWLVGDKISDVEAAMAAGCKPILLNTVELQKKINMEVPVFQNFLDAAKFITGAGKKN